MENSNDRENSLFIYAILSVSVFLLGILNLVIIAITNG